MLPALIPTQTVSGSDGMTRDSPDSRIQWHRYVVSPPSASSTSASRTHGTHRSSPMLGSAVSSRTPKDAQPRLVIMWNGGSPATELRTEAGPSIGCPHCAVGMQSARDSEIGLPSRSTRASRMLSFVTPPDVRRSFTTPPELSCDDVSRLAHYVPGPTTLPGDSVGLRMRSVIGATALAVRHERAADFRSISTRQRTAAATMHL